MTRAALLTADIFVLTIAAFAPNSALAWGKSGYYSYGGETTTSYTVASSDKGGASASTKAPATKSTIGD